MGITRNMAPEEAVQNIKNLLISSTEKGSQDHCSLLECYKLFDTYLTENNVERRVVVLSDGQTSKFDCDVMQFLHGNNMRLFLTSHDTTARFLFLIMFLVW